MLKSNEKAQIESHCMDKLGYYRNKDTKVTTDIIQDHPDVTFANEATQIEFTAQIMIAQTGIKKLR